MLDALSVVRAALRLVIRHWPTLLAIVFAGLAVRQGIFWLAVQASAVHGVLGYMVFALVPMCMLITFVLMLRVVRPSLVLAAKSKMVSSLGSVLVPFMAIYVAFDYFKDDNIVYVWHLLNDEVFSNAEIFDPNGNTDINARMPYQTTSVLLWVVGISVALRFGLSFWKRSAEIPWLAYVRTYIEVLWVGLVLGSVVHNFTAEWYANRRFVSWFSDRWAEFVEWVGPLKVVAAFLGEAFKQVDTTLIVPIAWLAIGIVVYGRRHNETTQLQGKGPKAIRWALTDARQELAPLANSMQVIRTAGLRPMLLFCVSFLIANSSRYWLWQVERVIIGPQDLDTIWRPLLDPLTEFNKGISIVLIICLVAAAADKALAALPTTDATASEAAAGDGQADELREHGGLHNPDGSGLGAGRSDEVYGGLVRS